MNINDYLIPQPSVSWARLLKHWIPPLSDSFNLWLANRLGDVITVETDGSVHFLNVGTGTYEPVAANRPQFAQLLDAPGNSEKWLRISVVNTCRNAGMTLGADQCYGFRIPPTLGGTYEVSNLKPTDLSVHYSYQAYVCKQTEIYWVPD